MDDDESEEMKESKLDEKELDEIPTLYSQKLRNYGGNPCEFLMVAKMNEIEKVKAELLLEPDISAFGNFKRWIGIFRTY